MPTGVAVLLLFLLLNGNSPRSLGVSLNAVEEGGCLVDWLSPAPRHAETESAATRITRFSERRSNPPYRGKAESKVDGEELAGEVDCGGRRTAGRKGRYRREV